VRKLITFAGTGNYQTATYVWQDRERTTSFIAEALTAWFEPDEVLVVLTPTAERNANWENLQLAVPAVKPLEIPEPGSESALWEIFRVLSANITTDDEIILDVTHAFRALPVIALVSASYLQALSGARITHILYGAWEAKQADGRTPVFDLGLFLQLQQWTLAAATLKATGDARPFGRLLSDIQNSWQTQPNKVAGEPLPTRLKSVGNSLQSLSAALALTRPDEIARTLPGIFRNLEQAQEQFESWALPFASALEVVKEIYAPLAGGTLASEMSLIQWYANHGQLVQAITFTREWLVSCTAGHLGFTGLRERNDRAVIEDLLNHAVIRRVEVIKGTPSPLLSAFDALTCASQLEQAWDRARNLRNDIAHCGMNKQPTPASTAQQSCLELVKMVASIPMA
jgi:CRISPR-associated DxTHG motif protein